MVATSIFLLRFQFLFLCHDLNSMSRPQQYVTTSNGAFHLKTSCNFIFFVKTSFMALLVIYVATSERRRDLSYIQLVSRHQCDVATSFLCCLGHPGGNLNLQVTTKLPIATPIFSCDFNSSYRLVSSDFC